MTYRRICALFAAAVLFVLPNQPGARAATPDAAKPAGEVSFPISCGPASQKAFDHAVWTLHSFWYPEALKEFTAITNAEPGCAMGYWGIAMSHWYPLWYPPPPAALKAGSEAVASAIAAAPKTQREKDYIAAIAVFYRDSGKLDHRTRAVAYEKAMQQVYLLYPEDREAAVFYALALDATALPTDKTYANQKKAAQILEQVWKEEPDHPGVAHYLIHSYDSPALAKSGLPAALRYAKIAPEVPHAQHMPSHIFTRLGMWQESIASNRAGHAAAIAYVQTTNGPDSFDGETVHTMDYLEYAYLQTAQDDRAKAVVVELMGFHRSAAPNLPTAYAVAAIPVRYALERRDWQAAAALTVPQIGFPLDRFPWAEAMISYAKALGDAYTGNLAGAEAEIANLRSLEDKLNGKNAYWAKQIEVQRLGAAGILAHAKGDDTKAVELTRAAADLDATMDKHPATPGEVLPARELYADLLLEIKEPAAALKEYRAVLHTDPNRFRSILGEARAAKQAGDAGAAREAYRQLLVLTASATTERPEIAQAKAVLAD